MRLHIAQTKMAALAKLQGRMLCVAERRSTVIRSEHCLGVAGISLKSPLRKECRETERRPGPGGGGSW